MTERQQHMKDKSNSAVMAAELRHYNANNRGSNVGDCVKRSISLAFDMPYNQVSKELNKLAEGTPWQFNQRPVYLKFIVQHGGNRLVEVFGDVTVEDFADTTGAHGCYLLEVHKGRGEHMVCVIDGTVYDSWDCLSWYVDGYYEVKGTPHSFTDIDDEIDNLAELGQSIADSLVEKYMNKYDLYEQGEFLWREPDADGWSIKYHGVFKYNQACPMYKDGPTHMKFTVVFTPTMDLATAKKKLKDTIQTRLYDRFYALHKVISETVEAYQAFHEAGYDKPHKLYITNGIEERFYNGLPNWVKPFLTYLDIQSPGSYSDSYELHIRPMKGDPKFGNGEDVHFYGYDAKDIKEELKRYKEDFSRVDYDYEFDEIY